MAKTKLGFIVRNSLAPHYVEIDEHDVVIVGRSRDSSFTVEREANRVSVQVPLSTLSERHARITVHSGAVHVEDLDSRNGTLLRLAPNVPSPLEDLPIWLGPDLAVRREDRSSIRSFDASLSEDEFVCWLNVRLRERGLAATLCSPSIDSIALIGSARHVCLRMKSPQQTVDAVEQHWFRAAVARYNASRTETRSLQSWRFQAASPARRESLAIASDVSRTRLPVLLLGESGSGKDVLAQDIHEHSLSCSGPWVPVNCAALPRSLVESELFGHARGAFTGANHERAGLVQAADGGTLFLDEIGDLSESAQASLLRFLESERGEFRRVGETKLRFARVRIIAATNRDLHAAMRLGAFRADLFHRLAAVQIHVAPPTRDDLRLIARGLFANAREREGLSVSDEALDTLAMLAAAHTWKGHVRELRHAIERWAQVYAQRLAPTEAWSSALAHAVPSAPPIVAHHVSTIAMQPSLLARKIADAIFLEAALTAKTRSELAHTLDVTYQGVDRRLQALQVTIQDKAALSTRLAELIADVRSALGTSPELQSLFNRFNGG